MFALHISGVLFALVMVFLADKQAFAWVTGHKEILNERTITLYHWLTWAALLLLITTGTLLAIPQLSYLLTQPIFAMKMLFVATLFTNAILIGSFSHLATSKSFSSLTWNERLPLLTTGSISFFGWAGALITALIVFG